jgi:hypothetical protein
MPSARRVGVRRFDIGDRDVIEAFEKHKFVIVRAAEELGIHPSAVRRRLRTLAKQGKYNFVEKRGFAIGDHGKSIPLAAPVDYTIPPLPSEVASVDEIIAVRLKEFERKKAAADGRQLIPVRIKIKGPVGLHFFGDPHLDDPGCDLRAIMEDVATIKTTRGMLAASIGDHQNLWIGRLARLYANQKTTAKEAWRLVEWFMRELRGRWLFLIAGNHDLWQGEGDPAQWIASQATALYEPHQVRLALQFPGGCEIRVSARHEFPGSSIWNPTHGQLRAAHLRMHDHLIISGHKHTGGYQMFRVEAADLITHCVQLGSYKLYDDYALAKGFENRHLSPSVTVIVNPEARRQVSLLTVYHDAKEAADYLTYLRTKSGHD